MADTVTVTVTGIAAGGDGIAREQSGRVVFVAGAIPGETVEARLTEQRRDFARAVAEQIVVASPDRVEPPCRHVASGCGGCGWQHVSVEAQRRLKRDIVVDALRRIGRVADPVVEECRALPSTGYRETVRLGVTADGRVGFRRSSSHDVIEIDHCLVAHPAIADQMVTRRWSGGTDATDVVLRATDRPVVAGREFAVSRESFFQIRSDGAEVLVELVGAALARHGVSRVVDLYCGVGLFAATLHDRGFDVVAAVEGNPTAALDARENLRGICEVVEADVAEWAGVVVDAVVADPSRRGLDKRGVATVLACEPSVIVLVSCDAAALGRDSRLLGDAGYRLEQSTPVDLFPHTAHVEVVSAFVKSL